MKRPKLKAEERTVLGKKVKKLRQEGLLPCNVYGNGVPSVALQVKLTDFIDVYKEVGDTGLIDLAYGEKTKPVLVKNLQKNYSTNTILHVDFYQVNMKQSVKANIPVVLTGEAPAVVDKSGVLNQVTSEIEIEALPSKLPENIEISIENLAAVGDQITVAELTAPDDVTILTDVAQTVVKIIEPKVEEPEPEVEGEEGAEGESTEGGETEGSEEKPAEENASESSEEKAE